MKPLDQTYQEASGFTKVLLIVGALCFICVATFSMLHLGFYNEQALRSPSFHPPQFLPGAQLWVVNALLGIVGALAFNYKRYFLSGISGLVSALSITGFSLLYLGWRESVVNFEILLTLGLGCLPGVFVYSFFDKKAKEESFEPEQDVPSKED